MWMENMTRAPIKCGLRIDPPAFILVYKINDKMKKKVMPLRNFKSNSNVNFVAEDLKRRHGLNDVPLVKIEKILRLLQELLNGLEKEEAVELVEKEFTIKVNEDLNKLTTKEIEFQKQLMDSLFSKNQIKQGSGNFVYDKQVDFNNQTEKSNWDDEDKVDSFWGS